MSEASNILSLTERIEQRRLASKAGSIVDYWTRPCPFRGCMSQQITPCEMIIQEPDGRKRTEEWLAIKCECNAHGELGRTEREAFDNWNKRT